MNQEKIGKFIQKKRKEKKLTQANLAEKLGVTDRSVSNWENGKNMPDLSLFKPLCEILEISMNDLMSGEKVETKKYNEKFEENIINTIDYVDKKNEKENNIKNFIILIASILCIYTINHLAGNYTEKDYITILCLILIIYSLKQFFVKYLWVRRVVGLLLGALLIISLFIK